LPSISKRLTVPSNSDNISALLPHGDPKRDFEPVCYTRVGKRSTLERCDEATLVVSKVHRKT
jgi:hypothetical protein